MNQERQFEKYLQGQSDLSQAYQEAPAVKLPEHLDAAILAEAHRAVDARPGGKNRRHWYMPLSLVATLFVMVMAGLMLPDMLKEADMTRQLQQAAPAASVPAQQADAVATGKLAEVVRTDSRIQSRDEARPAASAQPEYKEKSAQVQNVYRQSGAAMPVEAPAPVAALSSEPAQPELMPAPVPLADKPALASRRKSEEPVKQELLLEKGMLADTEIRSDKAARRSMAAPAAPMAKGYENQQSGMGTSDERVLPAEEWIKRIRKLVQENKMEEARKELAEFRKKYPDYVLPKDLKIP